MNDVSVADRWREDRTSFQRVYDVLIGSQTFLTAQEFADRADCSETAARNALEQHETFQEQYAVPHPDVVTTADLPVDAHEDASDRWEDLSDWQTVRRDIRILRRAVNRAERDVKDAPDE